MDQLANGATMLRSELIVVARPAADAHAAVFLFPADIYK